MPVNQFVYGIKLIGDASGGVSAINTLKNALGGLRPAADATSKALRALSSAKGLSAPIDQANLDQARLGKRKQGLGDSEERLRVAQKKLRDAWAEESYADMDRSTAPANSANLAQLDKQLAVAKDKRMTAERYVYNAEVNLARKTSEYRLALLRVESSERQKMVKMEGQTEKAEAQAAQGRANMGLQSGSSGGRDMAANTKQLVDNLDSAVLQISNKVKSALPAAWQASLQEIANREKSAMQQRLQMAIDEADKKKQAMITAERSVQQATAELQANPQSDYWKRELDARMVAYRDAAAASEQADTKAAQVSDQINKEVTQKYLNYEKQKQQAQNQTANAAQSSGKKMQAVFNSIKRSFNEIISAANKVVNSFRLLSQGLQQVAMIASVSLAAPIAAFFKDGIGYAIEFEQEMAKVQKASNLDDLIKGKDGLTDLERMEGRIRNLSKIIPLAADEIATFTEQAGQIGVQGVPALTRFTNLMSKLAVGTDVNVGTIAEDMGRIAAAFGMNLNTEEGMSSLEKLTSVMDMVAKKTATDMDGIVAAMKDAAVVGPMLDIPARQVAAAVGVLISSGVDASAAGTDVQKFFIQVNKNADKFAKAMVGYADVTTDAQGRVVQGAVKYKDANDVLQKLNTNPVELLTDSLKGLVTATDDSKAQQLKAFYDAAGITGGKVGAMSQNIGKLTEMLTEADKEWANAITLQADYERMLTTTQSQTKVLQNNIHDVGITLGEAVLPVINELASYAVPILQDVAAAFKGLDSQTKLLVVGIPLLVVALTPVLLLLSSLAYAFGLLMMSGINAIWGLGQGLFTLGGWFVKLGSSAKVLGAVSRLFGVTAAAGQKLSLSAVIAQGGFQGLWKTLAGFFASLNPWIKIPLLLVGALKLLQGAGVDIGGFFQNLAQRARSWGENLAGTFATGLANGAVKYISKVVSSIASFIARFFEAHSPPEEGPLSTIDTWGKGLMDTYLQGFLLADFSILSEVSSKIKSAFDILAGLGQMDEAGIPQAMLNVRQAISQLIEGFNKTGEIAQDVLDRIGQGLGDLGPEIQKMVQYWLEYKKIQEKLAALEKRKKNTNKAYDEEIKRIAKLNISAEEKAELMRQAASKRDDELRSIEEEKKTTEEEADAAKDKLDWQKEYVDALMENAQLLKDMMDKTKGGSDDPTQNIDRDLSNLNKLGGGSPVIDPKDETNLLSQKFQNARKGIDQFKNGFNGQGFGAGMSQEDLAKWQLEDPEGFKNAQKLYEWGVKAKDIWEKFEPIASKVLGLFGLGDKPAGGNPEQSPIAKFFNDMVMPLLNVVNLGTIFENMLKTWDQAFLSVTENLARMGINIDATGGVLQAIGAVLLWLGAAIITFIGGAIGLAINILGELIAFIGTFVADAIEMFVGMVTGIVDVFKAFGTLVIGIFNGDWAMILQGITMMARGIYNFVTSWGQGLFKLFGDILMTVTNIVIEAAKSIIMWICTIFGKPDAAQAVGKFFDELKNKINTSWEQAKAIFDNIKQTVLGWADEIIDNLNRFFGMKIDISAILPQFPDLNGDGDPGFAKGAIVNKPTRAWIAEGGESEAVMPLSKLPGLFDQMYGDQMAHAYANQAGAGGGINLYIQNPVIRDDSDIDKLAAAIEKKLSRKADNNRRLGR